MNADQTARYLSLLGVREDPPSAAALAELVAAHVSRVPFENLSKLIRHGRGLPPGLPSIDAFLDDVEHRNLGGTCYPCATRFNRLLQRLGYDAVLLGASMDRPDVHIVNRVRLDGRDLLLDVGYAAPFFAPLPLDADTPVGVALGDELYVLHPRDAEGRSRLDHLRDGAVIHGYVIDPRPRDADHFAGVVAHSFRPESEFLNQVRIVRHRPERSVSLRDRGITIVEGGGVRKLEAADAADLRRRIRELFGIPEDVSAEAIAALGGGRS